jgi:hypothetical protein
MDRIINLLKENYIKFVYFSFLAPIIIVAIISISHVTQWYDISNPINWATYLSVGIEIAALSSLSAISADLGKKTYLPFIIVTFIQFIGNIFFSYANIDMSSSTFKDWVTLTSPIMDLIGVKANDLISHRRFLALLSGGFLPIISLSFLHMLVSFKQNNNEIKTINQDREERPNEDVRELTTDEEPINDDVERVVESEENQIQEIEEEKINEDTLIIDNMEIPEEKQVVEEQPMIDLSNIDLSKIDDKKKIRPTVRPQSSGVKIYKD